MRTRASTTFLGLLASAGLSACASTGATFRSGVGDTMLDHAPWVAGAPMPSDQQPLGVLPVRWQGGASQSEMFEPSPTDSSALGRLLQDMQRYVNAQSIGPTITMRADARLVAPEVSFGCPMDGSRECDASVQPTTLGRRGTRHRLAVGRPSPAWVEALQPALSSASAPRVLQITLEIGQYLPRQEGLRGNKYVELGRDHRMELPWLTSVQMPVSVIQLTGAVIDRNGKAIRIAAEGLLAKRTPLLLSAINAQSLVRDEDVLALRERRREELPGMPLVWQSGIDALLRSLGVR